MLHRIQLKLHSLTCQPRRVYRSEISVLSPQLNISANDRPEMSEYSTYSVRPECVKYERVHIGRLEFP